MIEVLCENDLLIAFGNPCYFKHCVLLRSHIFNPIMGAEKVIPFRFLALIAHLVVSILLIWDMVSEFSS